ncbi:MAG: lipopolysaccharide heptosyltransferase II [Burkholderiales bacterium]|jgi:heptosyltransferase-2|nr:lipopolysaccharide heptosyltransferase II [Burkholderiales bacterium]
MNDPRILIIAPSWIGDAVLSEPLIAQIKEAHISASIDVFAPTWCLPVYRRTHHIHRVIENPLPHGALDWSLRKRIAQSLAPTLYTQAFVLPNSWKSALIPYLARIPKRTGYTGEMRFALLNDRRHLDKQMFPRLVDRFVALAYSQDTPLDRVETTMPVLIPNMKNRKVALERLRLKHTSPIAVFCPGAEYGSAKRWLPEYFAELARLLLDDGMDVWLIGSPKDRAAASAIVAAVGDTSRLRDIVGQTELGDVIDLLSFARVVISNDSGLMHIAAALDLPLVALFGSSSPTYTPPLSRHARIANTNISCSPCFKRECPLGHFRCMRDLTPQEVYRHVAALR